MEGYGLSSLGPTVGLSGLPDPMGDATAALEARRRQQVTDAGYPGAAADATNPFESILSALGPTINERAVAAREAMRRGDMATANALNQSLALDFGQFLGSIKPIRAYHGSPHDFDRFDMSKIGTGEGGQAYGHGLYFAENEGVARSYRDALSKAISGVEIDGRPIESAGISPGARQIAQMVADGTTTLDQLKSINAASLARYENQLKANPNSQIAQMNRDLAANALSAAREIEGKQIGYGKSVPGRMYEVDIHADPSRFLDWDKPFREQPAPAQDVLSDLHKNVIGGPVQPSDFPDSVLARIGIGQRRIASIMNNEVPPRDAVEAALREAGIPGIKYLDAGSRSAGDGSRNYVVFDDKLIEILRKYGIMAPAAGAGLSALSLDDEEGM